MKKCIILFLFIVPLITGCAAQSETGKMDYDTAKKMIVDILQTDEGKKAIQNVMTDDEMKKALIMNEPVVKSTIEKTLTSKKQAQFWKDEFKDPEFAKDFANSMETQQKQLLKDLMKDPTYQQQMITLMKDPDYEKEVVDLLKGKDFQKQLQTTIIETMETPTFKAKFQAALIKAAKENSKSKN